LLLRQRGALNQLSGQLEALSPLAILDRGYALVFDSSGVLLKDANQVKVGDEISARLAKGSVDATVKRQTR
jgi:exodeoxyribonuclease VII large subunit